MSREPIPSFRRRTIVAVVCSRTHGRSTLPGLLVAKSLTLAHGANRLASDPLRGDGFWPSRCPRDPRNMVLGHGCLDPDVPDWNPGSAINPDENVLVTQAWEETRRLMWNYVGIVRSNRRLLRARRRTDLLRQEITHDYWKYVLTPTASSLGTS